MNEARTLRQRKERLGRIVRMQLERAEGAQSDELMANRAQALDYYFTRPRGDEVKDRSQIVSSDVADSVNATLAMMREMLVKDSEVSIEAFGEEDEQQAKAEADVLNDVIFKDNPGEVMILSAVKDALLLKNGCLKVRVIEAEDVIERDVSDASEEQRAMLLMDAPPDEVRSIEGNRLKVVRREAAFEVSAVPIDNVSYQAEFQGRLQAVGFFAERIPYTRSDLVSMGVPKSKVDDLTAYEERGLAAERSSSGVSGWDSEGETRDQDIIDCHEAYVLTDLDGDGVSERYLVLMAGDDCLQYELTDILPYSMGSPFINPHRLTGESMFDRLKQSQDVNTALSRQLIDNATVINNGRYAYDPSLVSEDDVMKPKAGGGVRAKNPSQSIVPMFVPDVMTGILSALQFTRKQRSERSGAALDMSSADAQLMNKSATQASLEKGNQELISSMIAANLAATLLRDLYKILHTMMRRHAPGAYIVRVAGSAQETRPADWPERKRFIVRAGMSGSERDAQKMALAQHIALQTQAMQSGLDDVLASPKTIYRTALELLKLQGIESPERLGVDPDSEGAQEALAKKAEAAAQAEAAQAQLVQSAQGIEQAKIAEDARQKDQELAFKYYDTDKDAEIAEAKMTGEAVIAMERENIAIERGSEGRATRGGSDIGGSVG